MATVGIHKNNLQQIRDNYVGEKRNHLRDGYGVYKYENRFYKYEGQWRAGKKHGHGKLQMKDGSFYEGEFKDGEICGYGFKYWSSSRNTYSGEFYMGEMSGNGVMRYSDESVYEGQWQGGVREGKGKLTDKEGSIYEGEFHNHRMHGDGKHLFIDGSIYEGGYVNGQKHGYGVLKMADGTVFDGQWRNDTFNGQGLIIHSSGFTYEGLWVNGQPARFATQFSMNGDTSNNQTIQVQQGQCFALDILTLGEDGEIVEDEGRELKLTAGFKYQRVDKNESSSFFDAIEDVEETLIDTPFGYTILPYPLTDQAQPIEFISENTDLTSVTRCETNLTDSQTSEHQQSTEDLTTVQQEHNVEDDSSLWQPITGRTEKGKCIFSSLMLLPPPPLYRPFQQIDDSTDSKKVDKSKKPSEKKALEKKSKPKESEKICRVGTYVVMVEDATEPAFLDTRIPPMFAFITVKKAKRASVASSKDKGPNIFLVAVL